MAAIDIWEWFVSFFRRKRVLTVFMITVEGDIEVKRRKIKENKFEYKNGYYTVKKAKVYYNKITHKAMAFYYVGNPEPIDLEHVKHSSMSAEALKEVIRSDMVRDMYAKEKDNIQILLIILLCVIMLLAIIQLMMSFKVIKVE